MVVGHIPALISMVCRVDSLMFESYSVFPRWELRCVIGLYVADILS